MFITGLCLFAFSLPIAISMFRILYLVNSNPDTYYLTNGGSREVVMFLTIFSIVLMMVGIILMIVGWCTRNKICRTTINLAYTNYEELQSKIPALLQKKGYKFIHKNNEDVWKCGIGLLTAVKYIKIDFTQNNTLSISGWIRPWGGREQDLSGVFVCIVPKKQVQNVIQQIQSLVK